ncbi:MAG TPA: hypothetical protein VD998_03055 [Verrucomicrobiae bacterium]|nr:hypothetical protein [Verrucomicrobiae bacterium]
MARQFNWEDALKFGAGDQVMILFAEGEGALVRGEIEGSAIDPCSMNASFSRAWFSHVDTTGSYPASWHRVHPQTLGILDAVFCQMEVVEEEEGFLLVSDVPSERTIYFFKPGHRGYVPAEVLNCQHCRGIGTDRGDQANAQVHCGHEVEPFNVLPAAFREAVAALTATQPETPREL